MVRKKTASEKTQAEVEQSLKPEEPNQECSRGKCCMTAMIIVLVISCAVSYFVYEKAHRDCLEVIDQKLHACSQISNSELTSLKNAVANLQKDLAECKAIKQVQHDNSRLRSKWKAWMALKNKIGAGEAFDEELKQVKEIFADDSELLQKIDDLLVDLEKSANVIPQNIKKYVDKFVTLKRIDAKKVAEIDGYVLSSPCNGE